MSDYVINFGGAVNAPLLSSEMHAALPAAITGISVQAGAAVIVHFINPPTGQQQTDAGAVVAAHDANAQTTEQAERAALQDMIASFTVSAAAIDYFNVLQQEIRDVSNNNSIVIGTVFPLMRSLLQNDGTTGLYERYLNILRVSTGINQATFEGSPTTAQQHNAFTIAQNFANTGMIQMIAGVLFN